MGIADRIRTLCEMQGITINKLEQTLEIGRGNIARWDKHKPSVEKVQAVANYFGLTTEYILTGENENKPILMDELEMGNVSDIKMKMIGLIQNMPDDVLIKWYELLEAQAAQYKK